jgi:hypothetical protein
MINRAHEPRFRKEDENFMLTHTVVAEDDSGRNTVVITTEYDHGNRVALQVRYEHIDGRLTVAFYKKFVLFGPVLEEWVLLYGADGQVSDTYAVDRDGNPVDRGERLLAS